MNNMQQFGWSSNQIVEWSRCGPALDTTFTT